MNKETREAITDILEQYLNHRLVAELVDNISDRLADINSQPESEAIPERRLEAEIDTLLRKWNIQEYIGIADDFVALFKALNAQPENEPTRILKVYSTKPLTHARIANRMIEEYIETFVFSVEELLVLNECSLWLDQKE